MSASRNLSIPATCLFPFFPVNKGSYRLQWLISNIYKELLQLNSKKKKTVLKKWIMNLSRTFSKENIRTEKIISLEKWIFSPSSHKESRENIGNLKNFVLICLLTHLFPLWRWEATIWEFCIYPEIYPNKESCDMCHQIPNTLEAKSPIHKIYFISVDRLFGNKTILRLFTFIKILFSLEE